MSKRDGVLELDLGFVGGTTITQGAPTDHDDFYCGYDNDRWVYVAKSNSGGTSKIRPWFLFEITDAAKSALSSAVNYIMVRQPYEIEITTANWEGRVISESGARGVYFEVTDGDVDLLISKNDLNMFK